MCERIQIETTLPDERLRGAWRLVSAEHVRPDGERNDAFGAAPQGMAFFGDQGNFIITVMQSDRPNYGVCDRRYGTDKENQDTASGTITYFGTYFSSISESVIFIRIESSSFPNWNSTEQTRKYQLEEDRLKLISPGSQAGDGWSEVIWQRAL